MICSLVGSVSTCKNYRGGGGGGGGEGSPSQSLILQKCAFSYESKNFQLLIVSHRASLKQLIISMFAAISQNNHVLMSKIVTL